MKNFFWGLFVMAILLLMGGIFTGIAAVQLIEYYASAEWPAAEGNITHLSIDEDYDSDSGYTYRANIQYEFTVGGIDYYGTRYKFGGDIYSGDRGRAENVLDNYEMGGDVLVYYNPEAPDSNVLIREVDWLLWIFFGVGVVILLVAFIVPIVGLSSGFRKAFTSPHEQELQSGDYLLENDKSKF